GDAPRLPVRRLRHHVLEPGGPARGPGRPGDRRQQHPAPRQGRAGRAGPAGPPAAASRAPRAGGQLRRRVPVVSGGPARAAYNPSRPDPRPPGTPRGDPLSKPALVTGAAGFIGSHTAQGLLARGARVVGLDDSNPYYDPARKRANLAEVGAAAGPAGRFTFVE